MGLVARYSGPGESNEYHGLVYNSGGTARAAIYKNVAGSWSMISPDVAIGSVAGVLGSLAESVLGPVAERRGWMGNDVLNVLNTAFGAAIAVLMLRVLS